MSLVLGFRLKKVSFLIFLIAIVTNGFAQVEAPSNSFAARSSFKADIGILHSWGDVMTYRYYHVLENMNENQAGVGLTYTYRLSNVFYIDGHLLTGKLVGTKRMFPLAQYDFKKYGVYYKTNLTETSIRLGIDPLYLIAPKENRKLNLRLIAGHGLCYYESQLYTLDDEIYLINKLKGRTGQTTEAVTTLGAYIFYTLSPRLDLNLGTSGRFVWNDKLDAWIGEGSANDMYSFYNLGVTYNLGVRKTKKVKNKPEQEENLVAEELIEKAEELPVKEIEKPIDKIDDVIKDTVSNTAAAIKEPVLKEEEEIKEIPIKVETPKEPVIVNEVKKEVAPVKEIIKDEKPPVVVNEPKAPAVDNSSDIPFSTENGYFVIVGCFKKLEYAQIEARKWKKYEAGVMNLGSKSGTWYMVSPMRYDTKKEALEHMNRLRSSGRCTDAWVHVKM